MNKPDYIGEKAAKLFEKRQSILAVPYEERQAASDAGAVWNKDLKVWFVPDGKDLNLFERWIKEPNLVDGSKSAIENFENLMAELGLVVNESIIDDGNWHYVPVIDKKKKNLAGAYRFSLTGGKDGNAIGVVLNRFTGGYQPFYFKSGQLPPEQKAKIQAENHLREALHETEKRKEHDQAALNAALIVAAAGDGRNHGYIKKKGVVPDYALQISGSELLKYPEFSGKDGKTCIKSSDKYLLIEMYNDQQELRAVQAINSTGDVKSFMLGGQKSGTMHIIGSPSLNELIGSGSAFAYVEGYATGLSLYQATGIPVIVCFDAGNVEKVALQIGSRFAAEVPQYLAIDNDQFYPERALKFLATKVDLAVTGAGESAVKIRAGKGLLRSVSFGNLKLDGEWHNTDKGSYCIEIEKSFGNETVRQIKIKVRQNEKEITGTFLNKGLESGLSASAFLKEMGRNPKILTPEFKSLNQNPTDWNDMHQREGAKAISALLKRNYQIDVTNNAIPVALLGKHSVSR
jgi:hypothetical protein